MFDTVKNISSPFDLVKSWVRLISFGLFNNIFGGIITIRLGTREKAFAVINRLKLVKNLANLGDTKTLIIHPESTIYYTFSEKEKLSARVYDDLLRISVGIEDIQDIIEDFEQALKED